MQLATIVVSFGGGSGEGRPNGPPRDPQGTPKGPPRPGPTAAAPTPQDTDIQKKIDHEIRMREGACKLLAACTQLEQALEATKSLQVCNSRILAYMAELQRMKEAQVMQRAARR